MYSISNLGMFQVDHFCAIINPPQVLLLFQQHSNTFGCFPLWSLEVGLFPDIFPWHVGMHTCGGQGCAEGGLGRRQ
jgi:hypothetical protein